MPLSSWPDNVTKFHTVGPIDHVDESRAQHVPSSTKPVDVDSGGQWQPSVDMETIIQVHAGPSFTTTVPPLPQSPRCTRVTPTFFTPQKDRNSAPIDTSCSNSFGVSNISQHSIHVPPATLHLPSLWVCLWAQPLPWAALLFVSTGLSVGVFVQHPAVPPWFPVFYAGTSLLALAVAILLNGLQTRALLRRIDHTVMGAVMAHFADAHLSPVHDYRMQFIQGTVSSALRQLEGNVRGDALGFIRPELDLWTASEDGILVTDPTGVILWTNVALLTHFGYSKADVEGENVRLLMPSPYRQQHDSFLRRHASIGERCMLRQERLVPVVCKDGRHEVLPLLVKDRADPSNPHRRLFIGHFRFNIIEDVLAVARAHLHTQEKDEDLTPLFQLLDDATEGVLLTASDGTILYSNEVLSSLLQWTPEDLRGQNVKVLLPEPVANQHDCFLREYQRRAETNHEKGMGWPTSPLVESGRDVAFLTRHGKHVRVFMVLHRMDRKGGSPNQSLFLTQVLTFGFHSDDSPHVCPTSRTRRSQSVEMDAPLSLRFSSLGLPLKRRCTVTMLEVQPPLLQSLRERHRFQGAFLHLLEGAACHKGAVYSVLGDQGLVTFNAGPPTNSSHRTAAAAFIIEAVEKWSYSPLWLAASTGDCQVTQWGHQHILSGEPVDLCTSLLVVAREVPSQRPIIDGALQEELCYSYLCRMVNAITVHSGESGSRTVPAYQLLQLKEMLRGEWMYEVAEDRPSGHFLRPWERCWQYLPPLCALPEANYFEAGKALGQYLTAQPEDRTALWLRRVLCLKEATGLKETASVVLPGQARHTVLYHLGHNYETAL